MHEKPQAHHGSESSSVRWWVFHLAVVVLISALVLAAEHAGALHQWEMAGLDLLLRHGPSSESKDLAIVKITDEDYASLFGNRSPLDPAKVKELVLRVAEAGPLAIGVDLDISSSTVPDEVQAALRGSAPKILWVDVTKKQESEQYVALKSCVEGSGGKRPFAPSLFSLDLDGRVRGYEHTVAVSCNGKVEHRDNYPWALFQSVRRSEEHGESGHSEVKEAEGEEAEEEEFIFNYSGDRYAFQTTDAASILSAAASRGEEGWRKLALFKDKIMLIGGDYEASRDFYFTPLGERPGVELIALAIESELRGGGIREIHLWRAFGIDVAIGSLLVCLAAWLGPERALRWSVVLGLGVPLVASVILFRSFGYWLSFVPVLVGVMMHLGYDAWTERSEELVHLRSRNQRLERHLGRYRTWLQSRRKARVPQESPTAPRSE